MTWYKKFYWLCVIRTLVKRIIRIKYIRFLKHRVSLSWSCSWRWVRSWSWRSESHSWDKQPRWGRAWSVKKCPLHLPLVKVIIYKHVVARKIRLPRRFSLFVYWINKINKRMKYLASWRGGVYSATSSCFDLVGRCCRVMLLGQHVIQLACDLCLAYLYFPNFKHQLQKILLVEKKWLVEK